MIIRCKLLFLGFLTLLIPASIFASFIVTTPDKVVITSDGLYISYNQALLPVQSITQANDGLIVAVPKQNSLETIQKSWTCPQCGAVNYHFGPCKKCRYPLWESD